MQGEKLAIGWLSMKNNLYRERSVWGWNVCVFNMCRVLQFRSRGQQTTRELNKSLQTLYNTNLQTIFSDHTSDLRQSYRSILSFCTMSLCVQINQ